MLRRWSWHFGRISTIQDLHDIKWCEQTTSILEDRKPIQLMWERYIAIQTTKLKDNNKGVYKSYSKTWF